MDIPNEEDASIAEQAYDWFVQLAESGTVDRSAFAAWLKASPRHVGEFLAVTAVHRQYENIDPSRHIDVDELLNSTQDNVVSIGQPGMRRPLPLSQRRRWAFGLAATIVMAAVAGWFVLLGPFSGRDHYRNAVGEIRSFELNDGSVIYLNTQSEVRTHLSKRAREIELVSGEALFKVTRDPSRPFRVTAGNTVIQALGTQFNVRRQGQNATVAVLEGAVRIVSGSASARPSDLVAGQGAYIAESGNVTRLPEVDEAKVTAWRERRLLFENDSLADIAAEFNRYNDKPHFRIEGSDVAAMRFTGVFDAEAPESFIRVIGGVGKIMAERRGDEVVIRAQGDSRP